MNEKPNETKFESPSPSHIFKTTLQPKQVLLEILVSCDNNN